MPWQNENDKDRDAGAPPIHFLITRPLDFVVIQMLPVERWAGVAGKQKPNELRLRGLRRTIVRELGLCPINDRQRIKYWLPRLYAAYLRRQENNGLRLGRRDDLNDTEADR